MSLHSNPRLKKLQWSDRTRKLTAKLMTESSIGLMLQVKLASHRATWKTETDEVVTITSNSLEEHNFGKSYKEEERKSKKMKHNCMKVKLSEFYCHPIGADIIEFSLFRMGNNIYNAPRAEGVDFLVYHAVITESVMLYRGEYVAYCKMSNGVDAGNDGYVCVFKQSVLVCWMG
ncbi:unnamed protein product [Brassica rapa subsp. narinosa]